MTENTNFSDSSSLVSYFWSNKDNYMEQIKESFKRFANDEIINQMFNDKTSCSYIPDRLCEVVIQQLTNVQQKNIEQLNKRLSLIELCLGSNNMELIELTGSKIQKELKRNQNNQNIQNMKNELFSALFHPNDLVTKKYKYMISQLKI